MEDNTKDLPEKKYPESALAADPDSTRNDSVLAGVYAGPAQMGDSGSQTMAMAYAGPAQMGDSSSQSIGFVYAGPSYTPASGTGLMGIMSQMPFDPQAASMLMAYAGPPPEASHLGMAAAIMGPGSAGASQYLNQGKVCKICPMCNFAIAATARFCTECGASLEGVEAKELKPFMNI